MTIENYKQLDALIAKEINVKMVHRKIADTEKGALCLTYDLAKDAYYWTLGRYMITSLTPKLDAQLLDVLKNTHGI